MKIKFDFIYKPFSFYEELGEIGSPIVIGLHVKYPLLVFM